MKQDDSFFKHVRGFLTVFLPKNKCYSDHTVKAYRDTINLFRKFLMEEKAISFTEITFDRINHYSMNSWLGFKTRVVVKYQQKTFDLQL